MQTFLPRPHVYALAASVAMVIAGCTAEQASGPVTVVDDDVSSSGPPVAGLTVAPREVWGHGRAVRAVISSLGVQATVTTRGVFVTASPDAEPIEIDSFGAAIQIGPVAVSANGSTFAMASSQPAQLRVYDLAERTLLAAHDLAADVMVRALAFDPTGRIVADTSVGPWVSDTPTQPPRSLLESTTAGASAVLPDGRVITPLTGTNEIAVGGGEIRHHGLPLEDGTTVLDARSSPDGATIAITVGGGSNPFERTDRIMVIDATTLTPRATIDAGQALELPHWTVTNKAIVIAEGSTLRVWTLDGAPVTGIEVPSETPVVNDLIATAEGIVSIHSDGSVRAWSATATESLVVNEGGTVIRAAALDQTRTNLISVDHFGGITRWDLRSGSIVAADDRFAVGEATAVAISIDGTQVGVSSSIGRVTVMNETLNAAWNVATSDQPVLLGAVSFDPATNALAAGAAERVSESAFDDTVTVIDTEQRGPRFTVGGEKEDVVGCAFFYSRISYSNDGTLMAVTSHDFSVLVLDVATGQLVRELTGAATVLDIAFSPDDDLLVAAYEDSTVNVWNTTDFSVAASYRGAPGGYLALAVMPDSATMAVTDVTGQIGLVDLITGAPVRAFDGATHRTSVIALSTDGALLAAPDADATIGIWSTFSGERLATLSGHTDVVTGLAFAPQGDWLASSSRDGTARTWSIARSD